VLEDLDTTFTHSVTRDQGSNGSPDAKNRNGNDNGEDIVQPQPAPSLRSRRHREQMSDVNMLSLGGLLNVLDGVAASKGRMLFA
jgi:mitochondrial chaperone BCS1